MAMMTAVEFRGEKEEINMLLMIDNYEFVYVQSRPVSGELGEDVRVFRNDKITVREIETMKPDRIVHLARAMHTQRGGNIDRDRSSIWAAKFDTRRMSGASGNRGSFRRRHHPRAISDAWKDLYDPS